jgi:hypothetical protein
MATNDRRGPGHNRNGTMADDKVVSMGRDVQVKIGQHLRTMYDEVVKQGVPDHLNDLLQKLDNGGKKSGRDEKSRR